MAFQQFVFLKPTELPPRHCSTPASTAAEKGQGLRGARKGLFVYGFTGYVAFFTLGGGSGCALVTAHYIILAELPTVAQASGC